MKLVVYLIILAVSARVANSERPITLKEEQEKRKPCLATCSEDELKEHLICLDNELLSSSRCSYKCDLTGAKEVECKPGSWAHCYNQCTDEEKNTGEVCGKWPYNRRFKSYCNLKCLDGNYNTEAEVAPCREQ